MEHLAHFLYFFGWILLHQDPTEAATYTGQIYADNWFRLWVNGREVVSDPLTFIPHNAVEFSFEDGEY